MGNLRRDRGAGACGGLDPLDPSVGRRKGRRKLPLASMAASTLGFGASGLVMPLSVSVTDTGDFAIFSALIVGIATLIIGWMLPLKEVSQQVAMVAIRDLRPTSSSCLSTDSAGLGPRRR